MANASNMACIIHEIREYKQGYAKCTNYYRAGNNSRKLFM